MSEGRRSYSQNERDRICNHVIAELSGGRSVHRILKEDDDMPPANVFWHWHYSDDELAAKISRAREHGVEAVIDQAMAIADTQEEGDVITEETSEGGKEGSRRMTRRQRSDMLAHRKLRVETRLKYAQMIAPRKYGPKLDLTSDGKAISLAAELDAARRRAAEGVDEG